MDKLELPIGESSFRAIRSRGLYYVDKTPYLRSLTSKSGYWFLSRPRRFGKSLLISTLKELFECNESLFRGLDIHDHWDWDTRYPVVRLSFGSSYHQPEHVHSHIHTQLARHEKQAGIQLLPEIRTGAERLQNLIIELNQTTQQPVVILVDEYDKPIPDAMEQGNDEVARANRDTLRGFYGILKDCADMIRFVFITGISQFSKVSLFSGLNNLDDISLDPCYAAICGYTEPDLDRVFAPKLKSIDRQKIRDWYNGYHWLGEEKVYNPFDILLLLKRRKFDFYWYQTGMPGFLFQVLMKQQVSLMELDGCRIDTTKISTLDVGDIGIEALLFQAGYLTIKQEQVIKDETVYTLGYPNWEVKRCLSIGLLEHLDQLKSDVINLGQALVDLLQANDLEGFRERLSSWLAGIPWRWHESADLARYEAWYAGLLYACWTATGQSLRVEDASSFGQADLVLLSSDRIFVMELKVAQTPGKVEEVLEQAMQQMRTKGYAKKYQTGNREVHLIAIVFDREQRNVATIRGGAGMKERTGAVSTLLDCR